jgi:hypothetical protein
LHRSFQLCVFLGPFCSQLGQNPNVSAIRRESVVGGFNAVSRVFRVRIRDVSIGT